MSTTLTVRFSDEEAKLIRDYTAFHGITVSEFLRREALEAIGLRSTCDLVPGATLCRVEKSY